MAKTLNLVGSSKKELNFLNPISPTLIVINDKYFWCIEQYVRYHMSKAKDFREEIYNSLSFKQLNFLTSPKYMSEKEYKVDSEFKDNKFKLYVKATKAYVSQNPNIQKILKDTGNAKLVFNLPYDNIMGLGKDGDGKNKYGLLLMKIRDSLDE